jgi:hypothetical protein
VEGVNGGLQMLGTVRAPIAPELYLGGTLQCDLCGVPEAPPLGGHITPPIVEQKPETYLGAGIV